MIIRFVCRSLLFAASVVVCQLATAGELNLWVSYYFSGMDNYAAGEYQDANVLLANGQSEVRSLREDTHRLVNTLNAKAMARMALQDYEGAEKDLLAALHLAEKSLGRKSRWLPGILNSLGDVNYLAGKTCEAEKYYRRALDLTERDQTNVEVCRALNGMALIKNDAGALVEAEELLKRAVSIHEQNSRRWHPYCATNFTNLGILYTALGHFDEAAAMLERAAYIQEKALGKSHPDIAVRLEAQASLYSKTNRLQDAAECKQKAEQIQKHFDEINRTAS